MDSIENGSPDPFIVLFLHFPAARVPTSMDTDHTDDPAAFTDYVAEVTRFTITHAHHLSEDILQKGFTLEERERKLQEDEQNLAYEQEQLDLEEKRLHAEIALLQEQKTEVEYINLRTRKHIHLNVGGTILETSVFTLTSVPGSMLEAMFSGRHPVKKGTWEEHQHHF